MIQHRRQFMLGRWEGLTATYNRFHNPGESAGIARLRQSRFPAAEVSPPEPANVDR